MTLGELGENLACEYLINNGYRILKRNFRKTYGEIDIIAKSKNGKLIFIEVKALAGDNENDFMPEDHLTSSKLHKLQKICQEFVNANPDLINENKGWQIDLLAIKIPKPALDIKIKDCIINYYENI